MKFRCALLLASLLGACVAEPVIETPAPPSAPVLPPPYQTPASVDDIAAAYVKLVLALGENDDGYVDAYHGPAEWRDQMKQHAWPLERIHGEARQMILLLDPMTIADLPPAEQRLHVLRKRFLRTQLGALAARADILLGNKLSFDQEALALYDVVPPHYEDARFDAQLKALDSLLPKGEGTLAERYNRYLERWTVPRARLEVALRKALATAQYTTQGKQPVPLGEDVQTAIVTGKSWSAYNWYQGNFISRIELNADLPVPAHRLIELAAHEGYPGHHIYNGQLELNLAKDRGWVEFQIYPLYSPQSLIAEGSADFGIGLVFPKPERLKLLRELCKIGNLPATAKELESYDRITQAARGLTPVGIEAARRYLDGHASADDTVAYLEKYTLSSPERARQRIAFFEQYRSYVVNYSYGEELVRSYVERASGSVAPNARQWQVFFDLISTPRVPSGLLN